MKNLILTGLLALLIPISLVHADTIQVIPRDISQGDPVMITLPGISQTEIQTATIAGSKIYFFNYQGTTTALYGVDINQKIGTTTVRVLFTSGSQAVTSFVVTPRIRPQEFLAIPVQLGGNSASNQQRVVSILNTENADLARIYSRTDKALWRTTDHNTFTFPVSSTTTTPVTVTNPYGYNRESGSETITHKGVDFKAPLGTPVYAINRGVVRVAKTYFVYGNSIIVDHGLGLLSVYMHLSSTLVSDGQLVQAGQLIGYSGDTGYSEGSHLHLTIRINGVSIDPMKFFTLFGTK